MVLYMNGGRLWTRMRRTLTASICAFAGLALLVGAADTAQASTGSDEAYVHAKVNEARAGRLPGLGDDGRLDAVARAQAARMRDQGRIFHNPNNGEDADAAGYNWQRVGENVGVGPDVADVQRAFMASDSHRANILDARFTDLGIGVAVAPNGRVYVAQVFGKLREQSAPDAATKPDATKVAVPAPPALEAPKATEVVAPKIEPVVPEGHILLEDGSIVPDDYIAHDPCGARFTVGYDGTIIPLLFNVRAPHC
jgi:hypothetical protein